MIPQRDRYGRILTFTARSIDSQSYIKYLNGKDCLIYKKNQTIFGIDVALKAARQAGKSLSRRRRTGCNAFAIHWDRKCNSDIREVLGQKLSLMNLVNLDAAFALFQTMTYPKTVLNLVSEISSFSKMGKLLWKWASMFLFVNCQPLNTNRIQIPI